MQRNIGALGLALLLGLCLVALALGYWQLLRAPSLTAEAQNPRRLEQAARVVRGRIVDRAGRPLAWSELTPDGVVRRYDSPAVARDGGTHRGVARLGSRANRSCGLSRGNSAELR